VINYVMSRMSILHNTCDSRSIRAEQRKASDMIFTLTKTLTPFSSHYFFSSQLEVLPNQINFHA